MNEIKKINEPFIIAEIGANHNGNLELAKKTILAAKKAGCDAVKFQSWNENLFSKDFYKKNQSMFKQVKKYKTDFKSMKLLRYFSAKNKIKFGTAVFDKKQLEEALKIKCDFIKIASMDINNTYLLNLVSNIKNLTIISTGTGSEKEITKAAKIFHKKRKKNVIFLHCITLYPPKKLALMNLNNIVSLKKITKFHTGYSDHSTLTEVPLIAASLGAKVIEKHFTLNKNLSGWDHSISADPKEMAKLVKSTKLCRSLLGSYKRSISKEEKELSRVMRRGIYVSEEIKKGQKFNDKNIILQRPETKLKAELYTKLINKISKKDLLPNTKLKYKDL